MQGLELLEPRLGHNQSYLLIFCTQPILPALGFGTSFSDKYLADPEGLVHPHFHAVPRHPFKPGSQLLGSGFHIIQIDITC